MEEEYKISREYDGCKRKLFKCICVQCGKNTWKPKHKIKTENFCKRECYSLYKEKTGKRINVICLLCNNIFKRFQHHLNKVESKRYFCSRKCQNLAATKKRGNCLNCKIQLTGNRRKYCSNTCQSILEYSKKIDKWKNGELDGYNNSEGIRGWLRKYIMDKNDNKCSQCGWAEVNLATSKIPLQIDHIDGNHKNNTEENLRLLCPNCHSLTPTYGSLNKGKGREKRRLKLQNKTMA